MISSLAVVALVGASNGVFAQDGGNVKGRECLCHFPRCRSFDVLAVAPMTFKHLPLGQIRPAGWLWDQLIVQTNGLAGHQHDFYNYVSQSDWIGGDALYSNLEEGEKLTSLPQNGLVPNGVVVDDATIKQQTQQFLDYVFEHQDSTGWLGPEVFDQSKPRYVWGRYPSMFGVTQMIEYSNTLAESIVPALYKFVKLANTMLMNNGTGLEPWGQARWEEFVITLQWYHHGLYENYPDGNEELLLSMMPLLRKSGINWNDVFSEQYFPTGPTENLTNPFNNTLVCHGVNIAEGVKAAAVGYRFTHDQADLESARDGWDRLFQYHGRPSGIFAADEYLTGLEAIRGTELCDVVELMYSGSYLYQVAGDLKFADRVERVAYNALPATLTGNMWSRQYLQQQNQVAARNMTPNPFPQDGPYSNVFGLEPNYPCCTVNHPQGWPKFVSNSFVTTVDGEGLVQVYHGPMNMSTTLGKENPISVLVSTLYPFSDSVEVTVTAKKSFTYYVRIPSWVNNGTISVNGKTAEAIRPMNGLHAVKLNAGTSEILLNLPAEITIEDRPEGSIAVHRGPLHYAFDISRHVPQVYYLRIISRSHSLQQPLAVDLQFLSTDSWNYAIDPSTLTFHSNEPSSGQLPSPIFDAGLPPLTITATACLIEWNLAGQTFVDPPPQNPTCTGTQTNITLWPYGATKLRIGEFPTFKAT
ncbi:hypothetical protein HYDPIDRAFT_88757 [Hydnomerulius pinastri MD-312]|uniref:Uncharacterized protein n=1 Tax=Hydnomerulius pinastri MD-312 TaxID=994086 RepID=A0A0C9VHT5_9AGAM|nr:hypothetical protein HYDPIDRAFT_88757 [Hydnomerulius pinastri MD-312]